MDADSPPAIEEPAERSSRRDDAAGRAVGAVGLASEVVFFPALALAGACVGDFSTSCGPWSQAAGVVLVPAALGPPMSGLGAGISRRALDRWELEDHTSVFPISVLWPGMLVPAAVTGLALGGDAGADVAFALGAGGYLSAAIVAEVEKASNRRFRRATQGRPPVWWRKGL